MLKTGDRCELRSPLFLSRIDIHIYEQGSSYSSVRLRNFTPSFNFFPDSYVNLIIGFD